MPLSIGVNIFDRFWPQKNGLFGILSPPFIASARNSSVWASVIVQTPSPGHQQASQRHDVKSCEKIPTTVYGQPLTVYLVKSSWYKVQGGRILIPVTKNQLQM